MASNGPNKPPAEAEAVKPVEAAAPSKGLWREILGLAPARLPGKPKASGIGNKRQKDPAKLASHFKHPILFQHQAVEFRDGLSNRGGARGFFAAADIEPGTLLLAEMPATEIPDMPFDRDPAERCILHLVSGKVPLEQAQNIMHDISHLHPRKIEDIDADRYSGLQKDYAQFINELKSNDLAVKLGLADEATLIRVMCALHFNGFSTGVYLHLAMANHSCSANSVKWGARDGMRHSEVRAMRYIRRGEEITFSYLVPMMRSRDARQRALQGQFQFICSCELCGLDRETSILEQGPKETISDLEQLLEHIEKEDLLLTDALKTFRLTSKARNDARMKGVHLRNLALAHADMITIDACLALLDEAQTTPKPVVDDELLVLTLISRSISLRKTQLLLFQVGVNDDDKFVGKETRADAEVTLQHIMNGLGFFRARGKPGEKTILGLKDDENQVLFAKIKESDECQLACDAAARALADLYTEHDDELYGKPESK